MILFSIFCIIALITALYTATSIISLFLLAIFYGFIGYVITYLISLIGGSYAPVRQDKSEFYRIIELTDTTIVAMTCDGRKVLFARDNPFIEEFYSGEIVPKFEVISYRMGGWEKYWLFELYTYPKQYKLYI